MKKINTSDLVSAVSTSNSYAEVLKKLNLTQSGSMQGRIKKEVSELQLDISHFTGQRWNKGKTALDDSRIFTKYDTDVFVNNSQFSKTYIRKLVIQKKLIDYKCALCANDGKWLDKQLSLQLDHINGNSQDQRLENLRFLCPNCHSQTDTYCAKNKKFTSTKKVSDEQLMDMYKQCDGNCHQTLKRLGIDNGRNYDRLYRVIRKMGM
jgi:Zn finger protein HypA/HybF involved in hydrogenase expression